MDLFKIFEKEGQLVAVIEPGHTRLMVECFPHKGGLVFFDCGWPESSGHPIHELKGPIKESGGHWELADGVEVHRYDAKKFPKLETNVLTWARYKKDPEGSRLSAHSRAKEFFKRDFAE
jgi:hypothetical protein